MPATNLRATHRDYLHPKHLRVIDGEKHVTWSIGRGWGDTEAVCMSPSCSDYPRLYRESLPKWTGSND